MLSHILSKAVCFKPALSQKLFAVVSGRAIFATLGTIFAGLLVMGSASNQADAAPYGYYNGGSYGSYGYSNRYGNRRVKRRRVRRSRRHKKVSRRRGGATKKIVSYNKKYEKGTVIVDTSERTLYYMLGNGSAIRYRVAVGKPHMQWFGKTFVQLKRKNPGWTPTARMRRGGAPRYVKPGPNNPLGVRAINLGWSEYRIHGTNAPNSIGRAASSGCIRMRNADVVDLFNRIHIGAPVHVIR